VANGLHRVGPGVDDGQHGGHDAEEDGGHHGGDGADVELVHHQLALVIHHPLRAQHIHDSVSIAVAHIEVCLVLKQPEVHRPVGLLSVLCPLARGGDPVIGAQGGRQQAQGEAAAEKCHKDERPPLKRIHHCSSLQPPPLVRLLESQSL